MYLSGVSSPRLATAAASRDDLGVLAQPASSVHLTAGHYRHWAADNGCYSRGDNFDPGDYLAWLTRLPHRHRLLFAVAPDVVADHAATWARSELVLPRIRRLGIPAAFVAQNGMEDDPHIHWDRFDALFLGGTTAWKLGDAAAALTAEARARGLWVHMGRVNSYRRLAYAQSIGCHSADGTYLKYGPDINLPRLLRWLDLLNHPVALSA
jgi:hypothetical protein